MKYLTLFYIVAAINLVHAMSIYASLHGWFGIGPENSNGMQLLLHIFITAPVVCATTISFFVLAKKKVCSSLFWKVNIFGLFIPLMSMQTGVTYYHFDKAGLLFALIVLLTLSIFYVNVVFKNVRS